MRDDRHAPPAAQLVALACCVAAEREAEADLLHFLAATADPHDVWRELESHRLTALAGARLEEAGALPEALVEPVHRRLRENRLRSLHYAAVGDRVLRTLEARGIPALPLKGYALADSVHGDPGLRAFGDIDVLVPQPALREAVVALEGLGYHLHERPGEENLPDLHFEMVDHVGSLPMVELHWRIHWVEDQFAAGMLERSTTDGTHRHATEVDELASLLLYFARDGFFGLRMLADIAAWYDAKGDAVGERVLDPLAATYPRLAPLWWAALTVAERTVGVPAAELMTPVSLGQLPRLAMRMANWTGTGELDQVTAEITLVNMLLAPVADLPEMARRHVFISAGRTEDYYDLPPDADARRRFWQVAHPAKLLVRYVWALLRLPLR